MARLGMRVLAEYYRRLLPDICSCCVSRNATGSVARRGLQRSPVDFFLLNFWCVAILKKLNTDRNAHLSHLIWYYIYIFLLSVSCPLHGVKMCIEYVC